MSAPDGNDNAAFAHCMERARDAATPDATTPAAEDKAPAPQEAESAAPDDDAPAAAAPDLSLLLPGWSAAPPSPLAPLAAANDAAAEALGIDASAKAARAVPTSSEAPLATPDLHTTSPALATPAAREDAAPAATLREAAQPRPPAAADAPMAALPLAAPAMLTASQHAPQAAPPTAHLDAPMASPAFAPTLATQARWWAQDGVQQAQLTLNPPEMGPVAVKIVVFDGREARIDFTADHAATRGAIEAALPVLAAALDESGLKLSGGGVHDGAAQRQALWQQSQQQQQQRHGVTQLTRGDGIAGVSDSPSTRVAARATSGRGLVDLVA